MIEQIAIAIKNKDYEKAKKIIDQLPLEDDNFLWKNYYYGLLAEKQNNLEEAEKKYRQVIKDSIFPNPQITKNIRDGLERIKLIKKAEQKEIKKQKQKTLIEFQQKENSQDLAVLVIKPTTIEQKNNIAKQFAEIINLDSYTAKLQIPTRNLRLYQTGNYGELQYYQQEFKQLNLSTICHSIKEINQVIVYQVKYIKNDEEKITLLCNDKNSKEKEIILNTQEITNKINAIVPIFELTVHTNNKRKLTRKKETLDYLNFCDLHLKNTKTIIRFNDHIYQFNQGISIFNQDKTNRNKWLTLLRFLNDRIDQVSIHNDFTPFAEGAIQFPEMLKQITSNINIFRKQETLWDEAFQLYSALILLDSL
ncbi:hypothetical protein Cyast_1058 [Cyanobacterium stanieri PCC 7202]|uniref:Uncharacterized protein n=1 Tax=Cyanobacterium stanieri (strain ATCC 29140 / PCC 7202) TaxID=292563 RepID=K9YKN3_CYASC|nr:hypothetical protein Cyast_1058 [Cyanobacterium stanieri PCC 7202]